MRPNFRHVITCRTPHARSRAAKNGMQWRPRGPIRMIRCSSLELWICVTDILGRWLANQTVEPFVHAKPYAGRSLPGELFRLWRHALETSEITGAHRTASPTLVR